MRNPSPAEFPAEQERALRKARWIEWATIAYQVIDGILLYFVLGASQAVKAAWLEDIFAIIPPVAFLIVTRIAVWPANDQFPYGYHRAVSIGFFCAAIALFGVGLYLLVDSLIPFVMGKHPTIGAVHVFGETIWLGWFMLAVLLFSSVLPPVVLGWLKMPLARAMHDKVLYADAQMNKADWLSGAAAMAGVLGVGFGYWWADYVAAIIISLDIMHDGFRNLRAVISSLMDQVPKTVDHTRTDPLVDKVTAYLEGLDWVKAVKVRLRDEGHVYFADAFVVPVDETCLVDRLHGAAEGCLALDWRMYDVSIMPVRSLEETGESGEEQR